MFAPVTRVQPGHVFKVGRILVKCCKQCGVTRELEKYWSDPGRPGGVMDYCSECVMGKHEKHLQH